MSDDDVNYCDGSIMIEAAMEIDFNMMEVCCACLSKNPSHWLINKTADAYTNITGIELADDLPNQMCDSCSKILKEFCDFRTKCRESYEWLTKVRRQINNNTTGSAKKQDIDIDNINDKDIKTIKVEIVDEEEDIIKIPPGIEQLIETKTEPIDNSFIDEMFAESESDALTLQQISDKKVSKNNNVEESKAEILVNTKEPHAHSTNANIIKEEILSKDNSNIFEKSYKCGLCNYETSNHRYLVTHTKLHKTEAYFKCDICDYICAQKNSLINHMRTHTGEKPYKCNVCGRSYGRSCHLAIHSRIHTGEKLHKCDTCHETFIQKIQLIRHLKKHTGEKTYYECDNCNRSFTEKWNLTLHLKRHTTKPYKCRNHNFNKILKKHEGEKPYKCKICDHSFTYKGNLAQHLLIHTGEKTYKCDKCNHSFTHKGNLAKHIKTHTGEKPYKCVTCHLSFTRKDNLLKHMRIHTGEKPFKCDICNENFIRKDTLDQHLRKHNTGKMVYICDLCNCSYSYKCNLIIHLKTHSVEKPYKCEICLTGFTNKCNLSRHIKRTHSIDKKLLIKME